MYPMYPQLSSFRLFFRVARWPLWISSCNSTGWSHRCEAGAVDFKTVLVRIQGFNSSKKDPKDLSLWSMRPQKFDLSSCLLCPFSLALLSLVPGIQRTHDQNLPAAQSGQSATWMKDVLMLHVCGAR